MDYLGADARGHRPREGGRLSRRPSGDLRGSAIRRAALSTTRDAIGATLLLRRARLRLRRRGHAVALLRAGRPALRPAASGVARRVPARQRGHRARGARVPARPARRCRTSAIREGLDSRRAAGPLQVLPGRPTIVLDVAHNPHAARALAACLGVDGLPSGDDRGRRHARRQGHRRRDRRVAPRDRPLVRRVAARPARRDARTQLRDALIAAGVRCRRDPRRSPMSSARTKRRAAAAGEADRIVVFGSFLTVAAALARGRPHRPPMHRSLSRMPDTIEPQLDELRRRARRRLVGAIVLALAAAVFVPMLLESDPQAARRGRLGEDSAGRRRQVRQQARARRARARKRAAEGREPPTRRAAEAATAASEGRNPRRPSRRRETPPADATEAANRANEAPQAEPAKDAPSRRAPARRRRRAASRAERRRDVADAATARTAAAAFSVQLAAFADDKGANALATSSRRRAIPPTPSRSPRRKGRSGACASVRYATREARRAARTKLKAEGYNGIVAAAK